MGFYACARVMNNAGLSAWTFHGADRNSHNSRHHKLMLDSTFSSGSHTNQWPPLASIYRDSTKAVAKSISLSSDPFVQLNRVRSSALLGPTTNRADGYGASGGVIRSTTKESTASFEDSLSSTSASTAPMMGKIELQEDVRLLDSEASKVNGFPEANLSTSRILKIGVDVDEVLGSFLATLNIFCEEKYACRHDVSEFYVYDFMKIWNCSQAEANHRVHQFFESTHFNEGIPPIPGAYDTLHRLSNFCSLEVVTSRQYKIQEPTVEWLTKFYPGIFSGVHFGNHFALEGVPRPKSAICRDLGLEVLIDDNPAYAVECAEHGISVLLFDWKLAYPWSKTAEGPTHPLIKRVRDWHEVEVAIQSMVLAED